MKTESKNHEISHPDLQDPSAHMWPMFALLAPQRRISEIFKESPSLRKQLEPFHPVKSAALVSGLLTEPSLHANTLRLELLVHLLLAFGAGNRKPKSRQIAAWLNSELGSTIFTRLEDPVEDVFISNVTTEAGNARIFEGIWESSDFYLQRILNVVEELPDDQNARQLRGEIGAALRLSEEIAVRRRLARFCAGGGLAKEKILVPSLDRLGSLRRAIAFSPEDLKRLKISPSNLTPFILEPRVRKRMSDQMLIDSDLQRRPIVHDAGKWFILLPSAISVAVRRHIVEWMSRSGYQDSFDRHLLMEYQSFLRETRILDTLLPRMAVLPARQVAGRSLVEFGVEIDTGRYLQVIAIVDGLAGYLKHGFSSPDTIDSELSDQISQTIEGGRSNFRKQKVFKQGLTLLVGCGYGRPYVLGKPKETPDWRIEFLSAPDLQTLAWVPEASPLFLWKLVDHERFLAENGAFIANANGLLNLYGWWSDTNYMMLHPVIEFGSEPVTIMIPTDCLANIRKKVRQGWDAHALPLPDGSFVRVRRESAVSYFPGESDKPQYASSDAIRAGKLLAAHVGKRFIWWLEAKPGETALSRDFVFQVWDAVRNWLNRAAECVNDFETPPVGI